MLIGNVWPPLDTRVVDGVAMVNQFHIDSVLMGLEQKADKFCLCNNGVGCCCDVVGLLSNEEFDVPDPEHMVGNIGSALAVFAWLEEEEEGDPGEFADCNIYWGGYFGNSCWKTTESTISTVYTISCSSRVICITNSYVYQPST